MDTPFVIVGAGVGGLATALLLAHEGKPVVVLEKTDQVGGRNRLVRVGHCEFDGGPTLLMMLEPFRRLFNAVDEKMEDHLSLSICDPTYRVFFRDYNRLDATIDRERMAAQILRLAGEKDVEGFRRLLKDLEALFKDAIPNFVEKNFYGPADFFGARSLRLVSQHRMLGNLGRRISRYIDDERLQMLFSFQTMYLGLSPFDAPWVYAVLTYMEYGEGIWYPRGGVFQVAASIAALARERGAKIRLESPVRSIEGSTVLLEDGESIAARAVIVNADLPYAERALMGQTPKKRRSSCSTYNMYIDYEGAIPSLLHHNVFFGQHFEANLEALFEDLEIPDDPSFYAAISARTDPCKAPKGHENLYILVPCPNLDRPFTESDAAALQKSAFDALGRQTEFDPANIRSMSTCSPNDWKTELNLDRGAAFGLSHDFWQSAYFRPSNRSKQNPHVYFVGASTVPGNGLPMVVISAELVKERLAHDGFLTS